MLTYFILIFEPLFFRQHFEQQQQQQHVHKLNKPKLISTAAMMTKGFLRSQIKNSFPEMFKFTSSDQKWFENCDPQWGSSFKKSKWRSFSKSSISNFSYISQNSQVGLYVWLQLQQPDELGFWPFIWLFCQNPLFYLFYQGILNFFLLSYQKASTIFLYWFFASWFQFYLQRSFSFLYCSLIYYSVGYYQDSKPNIQRGLNFQSVSFFENVNNTKENIKRKWAFEDAGSLSIATLLK